MATHRPVSCRWAGPDVDRKAWHFAQGRKAPNEAMVEPKPEPPKEWTDWKAENENLEEKWWAMSS